MRDIFDGATVSFECLGQVKVPEHKFMDAITEQGVVKLSPDVGPPFTGAHWRCMQLDSVNSFALISAGAAGGFRYLNGRTQDGFVQTVGDMLAPFSGTRWKIEEISPGVVTIECLGDFHNPDHVFLDGNTQGGFVGLAKNTAFPFTGTKWGTSAQPSASLQVVTERNQLGADLRLIGANFTPNDNIQFTAEGLVGHGGEMHAPLSLGAVAATGADGRFEAPDRISFFSPPQPGDLPVIVRATDHHGRTASATTSGFSL
jgi:hypothetical protein